MAQPTLIERAWTVPAPADVYYPESDGRPMAETDAHARCAIDLRTALENYFAGQPDVYVSGNLLLYYQEGDPRQAVAPDVFVVRGVPKGLRRVYKLWEEGHAPDVIVEITSRSTRAEDLGTKFGLYQWLGVGEYFLFDPLEEYLTPALQGYRLVESRFQPVVPDEQGGLASAALGLVFRSREGDLRLFDPRTGQWLPVPAEEAAARREAEARAAAAETEVARLRAQLASRQRRGARG